MSVQDDQERSGYRRLGMSWPTRRESDLTYVEYFLASMPYRRRLALYHVLDHSE